MATLSSLQDIDFIPSSKEEKKLSLNIADVILPKTTIENIRAAISQTENTSLIFTQWGFSDVFEKGTAITLLFHGVPGTGKTLMAQAIATELKSELKVYGNAEIGTSEPGGSERKIKKIFEEAKSFFLKEKRHHVILFDECDSLLYDRNKVGVILGAQINAMLTEIENHDGVIILTTNRLGILDPALERRITAKIEFPFPDEKARMKIWKRLIPKKCPLGKDVDLHRLSLYPIAGGNIKNVILNAARMAAYKKSDCITMDHFVNALGNEATSLSNFQEQNALYDSNGMSRNVSVADMSINPETRVVEIPRPKLLPHGTKG